MRGKGVVAIKDLFAAYKDRFRAPQKTVATAFVNSVSAVCGIDLPPHAVEYSPQSRILSLRAPSQVRTEILLKKQAVLAELRRSLGEKNAPKDIL